MPVKTSIFDKVNDITQYAISNTKETLIVKVLDYGSIITNILFNDNKNKQRDIVLGYDDLEGYQRKDNPYFGALIGRFANRIANGSFTLNNVKYQLAINLKPNTLHGGIKGFDKQKWALKEKTDNSITLELISKDGDEHFPSTVKVIIKYTVTDEDELQMEYSGEVLEKKETIINLTNHSWFNLNGCTNADEVSILNHKVSMISTHYLEVDETLIPTGKIVSTTDVPVMDFAAKEHTLSERVPEMIDGYDHCYVIDTNTNDYHIKGGKEVRVAAVVKSPLTGISLTFSTTEPGFQFYSGMAVDNTFNAKKSQSSTPPKLHKFCAICLEAQRFPDAINQQKWRKQVILSPGERYEQKTIYKFSNK